MHIPGKRTCGKGSVFFGRTTLPAANETILAAWARLRDRRAEVVGIVTVHCAGTDRGNGPVHLATGGTSRVLGALQKRRYQTSSPALTQADDGGQGGGRVLAGQMHEHDGTGMDGVEDTLSMEEAGGSFQSRVSMPTAPHRGSPLPATAATRLLISP